MSAADNGLAGWTAVATRLSSQLTRQPPLLIAALFFAGGISADRFCGSGWPVSVVFLVAAVCLLGSRRFAAALLVLFSAGWCWSRVETGSYDAVQELLPPDDKVVEVSGTVASFPAWEKDRVTLRVRSHSLAEDSRIRPVIADLELHVYSSGVEPPHFFAAPPLPGDPIRFLAKLRIPDVFRNPGRLSPERRLREQRIHRVGVLKSPLLLDFQPQNRRWNGWLLTVQKRNRLFNYWPSDHPAPVFLNALVWGDRSALEESFVRRSQSVGVYHLLVVSGMHFALILGILARIARALHLPFVIRALIFSGFTALILVKTPSGPSVLRAAIVASGVVILERLWRRGDTANLLGAAALALLCYRPLLLFNAGFQFSFVCCFVLARVAPAVTAALVYPQSAGIQGCWNQSLDLRRTAPSRDARRIRFAMESFLESRPLIQPLYVIALLPLRAVSLLTYWVVVAFLIQNETFLLSTYHSNQGPGAALLANLVMIPLTSLLVPLGFLLSFWPLRLDLIAWLTEKLVDGCYGAVRFFDAWTLPDHPQAGPVLLGLLTLIFVAQIVARSAAIQKWLVLLLLALSLGWFLFPVRPSQPGAYFLDVGQGDCAALVNQHGQAVIIDAGTFLSDRSERDRSSIENAFLAREVVSRALWQVGVRRIDAIFVSHLHVDHISAVGRLARNFKAERVVLSSSVGADPVFARFVETLPARTQINFVYEGQQVNIAGFAIEVLHPGRKQPFLRPLLETSRRGVYTANDSSLVLRVRVAGQSYLFTGDMSSRQERALAGQVGRVEILKVAHHGSISSTSQPWLDELRPRIAVISAARRNLFGHPHPTILSRLRQAGSEVHRTDQEGYVYLPF